MFVETAGSAHRAGLTNGELNDTDTEDSTGVVFSFQRLNLCRTLNYYFPLYYMLIYTLPGQKKCLLDLTKQRGKSLPLDNYCSD